MTIYERVRVHPDNGSRPFTVILEITSETDLLLLGYEVDDEGSRSGTDSTRLHMIGKSLITRRTPMTVSPKYGHLVAS